MASPGTRSDGLRLQLAGSDVVSLRVVGGIAGVVVIAAAGRNGPGSGRLIASAGGLCWQAPGSVVAGDAVPIPADGVYLLEDGTDASAWLRVQAYAASLAASGEARVYLADRYNEFGPDDVTAANAAAGIVETVQFTLANVTPAVITGAVLWLDPSAVSAGLAISSDGVSFFTPTNQTDATALTWASINPASSVNVWVRRTLAAGKASNPQILNTMRLAWNGV